MSLETLKADLAANVKDLLALDATASPSDIVLHLKNSLWPFLEAAVDEMGEIDECVADMVEGADDIMQPETAAVFSAVIAGATAVAAALKLRIDRQADAPLYKVIDELEGNLKDAEEIMKEIVIDTGEPLDGEGDETDDDDDDDNDREEH